jgi:hypothetical protein
MKQKIGTALEKDLMKRAKRRAVDEGRPLSELIGEALEAYLSKNLPDAGRRDAAYALYCQQPMPLSSRQFKAILEHDSWDL